ncbi:spore morphogenesis/germination protein YwcE [Radiobacillus kanasensis]|uniref:spore morphogenesis/germination protein YwcE n=1 Tax=Radiobacillus kanasensis TaxID=2844358 RepID=UPI001E410106|nr:spore morphogenesis/germination protein YwcE [Radiobacillus kanasensis]UFT98661.1 spore morphogenesis/germination protein YwcE [Radiobacillus kanasensis]
MVLMVFLLAYLILFSITPVFLWLRNKRTMALIQIPFMIGAWLAFMKASTNGIGPNETYLWILFYGHLVVGHISTVMLLVGSKLLKGKVGTVSRSAEA